MINTKYHELIQKINKPQLIFIGKDPYNPNGANKGNIPFFKQTIDEFKKNCSGLHLFNGLGIEFPKNNADWNEEFYFTSLVSKGIVLLNASYKFISKVKISEQRRMATNYWEKVNKNIIENTSCKVLVAQSAYKIMETHLDNLADREIIVVPHPDYRNSWNKHIFKFNNPELKSIACLWEKYYKNKFGLKTLIG